MNRLYLGTMRDAFDPLGHWRMHFIHPVPQRCVRRKGIDKIEMGALFATLSVAATLEDDAATNLPPVAIGLHDARGYCEFAHLHRSKHFCVDLKKVLSKEYSAALACRRSHHHRPFQSRASQVEIDDIQAIEQLLEKPPPSNEVEQRLICCRDQLHAVSSVVKPLEHALLLYQSASCSVLENDRSFGNTG